MTTTETTTETTTTTTTETTTPEFNTEAHYRAYYTALWRGRQRDTRVAYYRSRHAELTEDAEFLRHRAGEALVCLGECPEATEAEAEATAAEAELAEFIADFSSRTWELANR